MGDFIIARHLRRLLKNFGGDLIFSKDGKTAHLIPGYKCLLVHTDSVPAVVKEPSKCTTGVSTSRELVISPGTELVTKRSDSSPLKYYPLNPLFFVSTPEHFPSVEEVGTQRSTKVAFGEMLNFCKEIVHKVPINTDKPLVLGLSHETVLHYFYA